MINKPPPFKGLRIRILNPQPQTVWKGFINQGSGLSEWHGGECAEIARINLEAPHILSDTSALKGLEFRV